MKSMICMNLIIIWVCYNMQVRKGRLAMDEIEKDTRPKEGRFPQGKYAWTVTVGERGQIVIPKQARQTFDIKPGDTLIVLGDESRGIAIPRKEQFGELMATVFDKAK